MEAIKFIPITSSIRLIEAVKTLEEYFPCTVITNIRIEYTGIIFETITNTYVYSDDGILRKYYREEGTWKEI